MTASQYSTRTNLRFPFWATHSGSEPMPGTERHVLISLTHGNMSVYTIKARTSGCEVNARLPGSRTCKAGFNSRSREISSPAICIKDSFEAVSGAGIVRVECLGNDSRYVHEPNLPRQEGGDHDLVGSPHCSGGGSSFAKCFIGEFKAREALEVGLEELELTELLKTQRRQLGAEAVRVG